jgi:hypothetical protein
MDSAAIAEKHSAATSIYSITRVAGWGKILPIIIEYLRGIQHTRGTVKVSWPTENAAACATFLRDLLR